MTRLTISSKGQIVIPAVMRKKYKLVAGSCVHIVDYGGVLAIVPALENPVAQACGILKGESSLTKALLADRANDQFRKDRPRS